MFVPDSCHAARWMTWSNKVSAAAAKPVLTPIKQMASQNRTAPGLASEVGICPLLFETGFGMQTPFPGDAFAFPFHPLGQFVLWSQLAARVIQRAEGQKVIVSRIHCRDGRLGALQLCLA